MNSQSLDTNLQLKELKKELKAWEHLFAVEHSRKPDKKDISQMPDIGTHHLTPASKYKAYSKLKSDVVSIPDERRLSTKEVEVEAPPEIQEIPQQPKKKRFEVGDVPVSKADIGQNIDRFAKKLVEREGTTDANTVETHISLNAGNVPDPVPKESHQTREFMIRKQVLDETLSRPLTAVRAISSTDIVVADTTRIGSSVLLASLPVSPAYTSGSLKDLPILPPLPLSPTENASIVKDQIPVNTSVPSSVPSSAESLRSPPPLPPRLSIKKSDDEIQGIPKESDENLESANGMPVGVEEEKRELAKNLPSMIVNDLFA